MIDRQRIAALSPEELHLLAQNLLKAKRSSGPAVVAEATNARPPAERMSGVIPVTPSQKSYFDFNPAEPNYFIVTLLQDCTTRLSAKLMGPAIRCLLAHHDALRVRFHHGERGWRQEYAASDEQQCSFESVDLAGLDEPERQKRLEKTAELLSKSLNLTRGPLLGVVLFDLGAGRAQRLLMVIHHLLVDLASLQILLEDLQTAHEQLALGREVHLPARTTAFAAYAEKLHAYAHSAAAQKEVTYWLSLPWASVEHLPVDRPHGVNTAESVRTIALWLSIEDTSMLTGEAPLVYRARINKVLLAVLLQAVSRWSGRRTLAVDVLEHGRNGSFAGLDLTRTVGWFSSEYPLVLKAGAEMHSVDILRGVSEQMRSVPNDGVTYGVLRYLSPASPLSAIPVPQVRFNYQGRCDHQLVNDDIGTSTGPAAQELVRHYGQAIRTRLLNVTGLVIGERLRICIEYSAALHERRSIESLAAMFNECLQESVGYCRSVGANP